MIPPSPVPPTASRGDRRWLRAVLLPSLLLMVAMLNLTLIVAGLKELMLDELGGTAGDASLFFSIETIAYVLFAPVWGLVSDRLGRRKPLVIVGFLITGALYASYALVTSIPLLLALRFVQGATAVMGWSTLMAMVLDHPDEARRGRYMGVMGGALALGISVGAPLGGALSSALGPRAPLEAAALLFALLGIGGFALREGPHSGRRIALRQIAGALTARPRLLLPWAFYFVDRFTVGFFVVLFPLYLASIGVAEPAVRGRYLAYFLFPFALLQPLAGRLLERIGPYKPLLGGSLAYGILLCWVGYADLYTLSGVMVVLGALAAVMFPPAILLTARWSDPETRGSAMGGFNLAGSLGFAVGPLVGTWAHAAHGYGFAFVVAGGLEVVAVAVGLVVIGRRRGDRRPPIV